MAYSEELGGTYKCIVWTKCSVLHLSLAIRNGNHQALKRDQHTKHVDGRTDRQTDRRPKNERILPDFEQTAKVGLQR
jgi:hypothetical protein